MLALERRKPTAGPELQLVEAALASRAFQGSILFREPKLPTGFPDVVAVTLSEKDVLFSEARLALRPVDLKVIHHLFRVRGAMRNAFWRELGLTRDEGASTLRRLEAAELVCERRSRIFCNRLAAVFAARKIVAVEAKMRDWNSALRQAAANTWFASDSYVLFPPHVVTEAARAAAERLGIGIMTHDGVRTRIPLRARRQRIPSSYGSWIVNEWTVRSLWAQTTA